MSIRVYLYIELQRLLEADGLIYKDFSAMFESNYNYGIQMNKKNCLLYFLYTPHRQFFSYLLLKKVRTFAFVF